MSDRFALRQENPELQLPQGTPGEPVRISKVDEQEYLLGIAWGDPDQTRQVVEYSKDALERDTELVRQREPTRSERAANALKAAEIARSGGTDRPRPDSGRDLEAEIER